MKQIRRHLTYANVMSSLAVFMILGGATAFAATKIGAKQLKANSVKTGKIVKEAVTEGKIKNGAVSTNKIADAAVTTAKIANGAVLTDKLADLGVTTGKLANDAVTTAKLGNNAVTTDKIANNAITAAKIAAGAVGAGKLAAIQRVVVESATASAAGETREAIANCPAGSVLISGGAGWVTTGGNVSTISGILRVSQPLPTTPGAGAPTGWQATGEHDTAFERRLRAYAICLQVG